MVNQNYTGIIVNIRGKTGSIFLDRPEVHNALDAKMISDIRRAVLQLNDIPGISIIVIRGKGKSFSSGADLNYMKQQAALEMKDNLEDARNLASLFRTLYESPHTIISVAHGMVAGGANGILAASDICLAEMGTKFRFSEVRLGLIPATIAPYVIRRTGVAAAREWFLTGRTFYAEEAKEKGLVNLIEDAAVLETRLESLIQELLSGGPEARRMIKSLLNQSGKNLFTEEYLEETVTLIAQARASSEAQEGISAFFEKRNPNWIHEDI